MLREQSTIITFTTILLYTQLLRIVSAYCEFQRGNRLQQERFVFYCLQLFFFFHFIDAKIVLKKNQRNRYCTRCTRAGIIILM